MGMYDKAEALERLLADVADLLEDLYQSGFDTVHDSTLEALKRMAGQTAVYGMELLSDLLSQLTDGLAMRRHQIEHKEDSLIDIYAKLNQYIDLCREKIEQDKGIHYYLQQE